jgi:general secretion pathway protein B
VAIAALLAVNLGIVLWMLLRSNAREAAAANPVVSAPATLPAPQPPVAAAPAPTVSTPPPLAAAPASAPTLVSPPAAAPPVASTAPAMTQPQTPAPPPQSTAEEPQNPQDYAPAQDSAPGSHVRRASAAGVPLYQDAAATPGTQIPQLHLDFHMYAPAPQDRFVMINMHKLKEGDVLEGVHVNSITPEGAVLSYNGQTFMLPRE